MAITAFLANILGLNDRPRAGWQPTGPTAPPRAPDGWQLPSRTVGLITQKPFAGGVIIPIENFGRPVSIPVQVLRQPA